jgi:Zn-finger nucleic acid-binding protein
MFSPTQYDLPNNQTLTEFINSTLGDKPPSQNNIGRKKLYTVVKGTHLCGILLEECNDCVKTICNHYFDKSSIDNWLEEKDTCPMCRFVILKDNEQEQELNNNKQEQELNNNEQEQELNNNEQEQELNNNQPQRIPNSVTHSTLRYEYNRLPRIPLTFEYVFNQPPPIPDSVTHSTFRY